MAVALILLVLCCCQSRCGGSQRLGKTMYSLAVEASKKLMYPKSTFGDIVLHNIKEYNKHLKYMIEELDKGNQSSVISSAKYLYRKGMPRYAKMIYNPKILQDKFLWMHNDVKYFYDMYCETSELYKQFLNIFRLKVAFNQPNWTPKPDFFSAKVTTYKVKKRKIKEIITG
ncbi:hypothetical protein J6590_024425 [Homalodisca vitripennis]|nr:hypothetical protein J6590_024425 [Homalodisca vitripennis]